ncbi:hypothetical protein Tco_1451616, partial [Tanacetum coccineum]
VQPITTIISTSQPKSSQVPQREGKGIATNKQLESTIKKLVPASKVVSEEPDKPIKKEDKIKKATEEANRIKMTMTKVIKIVPEEAENIGIDPKKIISAKAGMEDSFKKHVDSLLKIGVIRPSKSRHRTMAMIINSGTTIDLVIGREVKGKENMVFNYKSLNDNTYNEQYSLPGINTIIKRIGGAKIFSKFDLKSGFHQVAMDEESIP